jgi:hypothetical protein
VNPDGSFGPLRLVKSDGNNKIGQRLRFERDFVAEIISTSRYPHI